MKPVDVVVLSLNRQQLIFETINNILQQKNIDPHIWIVDQGSEPPVVNALRSFSNQYANIHLLEMGKNLGVPGGRNVGMRQGTAPYVVSIDNDAIFASDEALIKIVNRFEMSSEAGALAFRIKNYFTGQDDLTAWVYPRSLLPRSGSIFKTACFAGCAHALRREVLEQTNWYEEQLFFNWEERDLAYQIINRGYSIEYHPEVEVLHKISPDVRRDWSNDRFYYLARNAVYLHYKYFRSPDTVLILVGYFLKGLYNKVPQQALRATVDALKMMVYTHDRSTILTKQAREYVYEHELRYRGSLWMRFRSEVLHRLP
ncbi:MAG: glycosyltransferase [Chloroflexi bacterium]|nr:glycosyltransferase [Chloroflexota bacterium]